MNAFEFRALPWNIVFGAGAVRRVGEILAKIGGTRALVLATPEQHGDAARIAALLGERAAGVFDRAVMHVPAATVAEALEAVRETGADSTVSVGGGSTTGLSKVLKLRQGLPHVAIPTTYAGSEMTNIWAVTEAGRKTTGRDDRVVPGAAIYDPEMTLSLPPHIAGPSGLNALAQGVVNVCSGVDNPIVNLIALEAIRMLAHSLPRVVEHPNDRDARSDAMFGACLAGAALGTGTAGLHHRLCHTLGGSFNTPHAETHAILLPHTVAHNAMAVAAQTRRVAEAIGVADAAQGIYELARKLGAKVALEDVGFRPADLERAVDITLEQPFPNPAPVTRAGLLRLLTNACHGRPPGS
jgi:alcohol dehydrogenase class IV